MKSFEINMTLEMKEFQLSIILSLLLMELYQAYADYNTMMDITEDMLSSLVYHLYGKYEIEYDGQKINMAKPWKRITMQQIVKKKLV